MMEDRGKIALKFSRENDLEFQVLFSAKPASKNSRTNKYILGMQRFKHVLKGIPSGGLTEDHKIKETVIRKLVKSRQLKLFL